MEFSAHDLTVFLLVISLILFAGRTLGEIFIKFRQPAIIGEILAGVLLGPTLFGALFPDAFNWLFIDSPNVSIALKGLENLAIILLLLVLGMEVDLSVIIRNSKTALFTSFAGTLIPFIAGFFAAYYLPDFFGLKEPSMKFAFALFMGTAMSISALPVIARTLLDMNLLKTEIGMIIIASAMFSDLAGWIVFSVIIGLISSQQFAISFPLKIGLVLLFTFFVMVIGRRIFDRIMPFFQKKLSFPGAVLNLIFIVGLISAAMTEMIGIHAIFGSFIIGIAIGDSVELKEKTREIIHQFVTNIFAPIFFVSIGLGVNFVANFDPLLVLVILIIAFAGKVIGSGFGAYFGGKGTMDSLAIGFGMNSRGAMEIILGLLALKAGLIQEALFVALVIMALITSLSSGPLMTFFLEKRKTFSIDKLLNPEMVFFTNFPDKKSLLIYLCRFLADKHALPYSKCFDKIWEREETNPTGIANYLAIPHAKLDIKKPLLVVAVNKTALDFESADGLGSKIIFMIITPKDDSLLLKLFSETVTKFKDKEKVENLLGLDSQDSLIFELKNL